MNKEKNYEDALRFVPHFCQVCGEDGDFEPMTLTPTQEEDVFLFVCDTCGHVLEV